MKLKELTKSRTLVFNAVMAGIPLFNSIFPQVAIGAEIANQALVFGNMLLRFVTEKPVGVDSE